MALALLAACTPAPGQGGPPPTITPDPRNTIVPAQPTPRLAVELLPPTIQPATPEGQLTVVGVLANRSSRAAADVILRVTLEDSAGKALAATDVPTHLPVVGAGQTTSYSATFPGAPEASAARAEVLRYTPYVGPSVALQPEIERTVWLGGGRLALLGRLHNPTGRPASLRGLSVLAVDSGGNPSGLLLSHLGPGQISARDSVPFYAEGLASSATTAQFVYAFAVPATGSSDPGLSFDTEPQRKTTAQGEPFVVGALRNENPYPVHATVHLVFQQGETVIGLAQLAFPLPMAPGETRPFSLREPNLLLPETTSVGATPGADLEQTVQGVAEAARVASTQADLDPLTLALLGYEFTGSRVFLRGEVTNASHEAHRSPTVLAAIRSTDGEILGASFLLLAETLSPGDRLPFVLAVDVPAQVDPAMAEFDVRALGIVVER